MVSPHRGSRASATISSTSSRVSSRVAERLPADGHERIGNAISQTSSVGATAWKSAK
jgi:hypothetical protein